MDAKYDACRLIKVSLWSSRLCSVHAKKMGQAQVDSRKPCQVAFYLGHACS